MTSDGTWTHTWNYRIATITAGAAASGIAFNATSTIIHGGFTSGPTTKNWTHTTSGSNRLLVLFADIWQDVGGTGTITSATYNGVSLTKATSTRGGGMASEIWYLANPASGSNTVSVTVTGATDAIKLAAAPGEDERIEPAQRSREQAKFPNGRRRSMTIWSWKSPVDCITLELNAETLIRDNV